MRSFCVVLIFVIQATAFARPVAPPDTSTLWAAADLVVELQPFETKRTGDVLAEHEGYQGLETRCFVWAVFKGADSLPKDSAKWVRLRHFAYKSRMEFNGGHAIFFHKSPTQYLSYPSGGYDKPLHSSQSGKHYAISELRYLAFLKRLSDGRFAPAGDDYDSEFSFRLLSIPDSGAFYYFSEGLPDDKPAAK